MLTVTALRSIPAAFSDIRTHFLPDRFLKQNDSPEDSSVQNSLPRVSTADIIIKTAISAAILTLFLAVPQHILNIAP
jgi:hypothetical protein